MSSMRIGADLVKTKMTLVFMPILRRGNLVYSRLSNLVNQLKKNAIHDEESRANYYFRDSYIAREVGKPIFVER